MEANFERLLQESNMLAHFVKEEVVTLEPGTLAQKPGVDQWSVIEVVDHLNLVYDKYLDNMSKAIEAAPSLLEGKAIQKKKTVLGSLSVYAMAPKKDKIRFKMKTFDFFTPEIDEGEIDQVLGRFLANKERFNDLVRAARTRDIERVKIPTSLGEKVRFYLFQCMEFIIAHEKRHIVQMQRLIKSMD